MRISDWSSDVCSSDLRGWTQARPLQSDAVRYEGTPVRYELTLEATRMPWLMALDLPQPVGLPPDVTLNHDGELLSRKPVNERIRRSEEHTSELQSLMRISYAVFCLQKKNNKHTSEQRVI